MSNFVADPAISTSQTIRGAVSSRRLMLIVAGTLVGILLAALDQTIVGAAMPRVMADLNGLEHYSWVFTAYMLTSTVTVPIYGKLSDSYGRRPFFLGGMALFLLGSALAGMSQSMTQLIVFRGLQGLGAGAMLPITQAIIGDIFPPAERGKWQGLLMMVYGLATVLGPTLGGWITDTWGWRWVFYVNMPIGAFAIAAAGLALPRSSPRENRGIDYLGATTLVAGAAPLLLGFSWAGSVFPWRSPQIAGLFAFAIIMLIACFVIEQRAHEPIISPAFFRNSVFSTSVLITFLVSVGMFGTIMYVPLFVQAVVGKSATSSGAVAIPMMLSFLTSNIISGQIMARTGRYKLLALVGCAVAASGMFLLGRMGVDATMGLIVRNLVITGLGLGMLMGLFIIVVQNAFPSQQLGQVTSSLQFFRSIGGAISVALLGTVMTNRFQSAFMVSLPPALTRLLPPEELATLRNAQVLLAPEAAGRMEQSFAAMGLQDPELVGQVMLAIRQGLASAITDLFTIGGAVMVLAFVVSFFLREIPLRKRNHR